MKSHFVEMPLQNSHFIYFSVRNATRWIIIIGLITLSCWFPLCVVRSPPRSFFRQNHLRIVRKRCSHSTFSSQAIILDIFDQNIASCNVHDSSNWVRRQNNSASVSASRTRFLTCVPRNASWNKQLIVFPLFALKDQLQIMWISIN